VKLRSMLWLAGAAICLVLVYAREHERSQRIDQLRGELESVTHSLGELRSQQQRLAGEQQRLAGDLPLVARGRNGTQPGPGADPTPPVKEASDPGRDAPAKPAHQITEEEMRDQMQTAFAHGAVGGLASKLRTLAQAELPGRLPASSSIQAIECRGSLCRIQSSHRDQAAYGEFLERAFQAQGTRIWNGAYLAVVVGENADTSLSTVTYVAAEDTNMPVFQ
jgi:hypothetical protein